jgi:AraC-like DNA-binding protein
MGVSVLGVWEAQGAVETACAVAGLVWAGAAVAYRFGHPLIAAPRPAAQRRPATDEDARLARRIVVLLEEDALYSEPGLKIGDLAARLRQPEHRLSHCITAQLGFTNFNRLINHYRIERAKRLLASEPRRPILQVAFDCGFASLGPFNRAYKHATGLTPTAFRGRGQAA